MSGHDASCAQRLRTDRLAGTSQADAPPPLVEAIAAAIMRCCGHRALKAHRLAHGLTLDQAVAALHAMCREHGLRARGLAARSWLEWESGEHPPNADYQDLLCRLFRVDPVTLGFSHSYELEGAPPMSRSPSRRTTAGRAAAAVHDASCAHRIRVLRLAEAGDPPSPPAALLHEIAAEISSCCGLTPMRAHRLAFGWTVTAALAALRGRAGPGEPRVSMRTWQDWEAGQRPNRRHQDQLCQLFSTGPVELGFGRDYREPGASAASTAPEEPLYTLRKGCPPESRPQQPNPPDRLARETTAQPGRPAQPAWPGNPAEWSLVMDTAHESTEHATANEPLSVGPDAIGKLSEDIARLARAYLHTPPLPLFGELVRIRDNAYWLLDQTRNLTQQRDLYMVAGQACGLLAMASFDLGHPDAGTQQARAARVYGAIIDGKELSAFADFALSVIECWAGRPRQGLLFAERGLSVSPDGACKVRLWSQVARAAALRGDEQRAVEAITAARLARDDSTTPTELHDQIGGEFGYNLARQAFGHCTTYLKLGRPDEALAEGGQVIELYAQAAPEERYYMAQAGAHADIATAHLLRGDLDGTRDAISPVLALDPGMRTATVVRRLGTLREVLAEPKFQHRAGQSLAEEIEHFTAATAGHGLPTTPA